MHPGYLDAFQNGLLSRISARTFDLLKSCSICPRRCKVNRQKDEKGYCRIGLYPVVYSFMAHHGEEPPISGTAGSGTIFFSGCNMKCAYCQNHEFSQTEKGRKVRAEELAEIMLQLQQQGCHNINFVTPTHVLPQILKSLEIAIPQGLKIPLVYNTSGYELPRIIKLLTGIVDIYLVDMRYADSKLSEKFSQAPDYPKYNQRSVLEMHKQAGVAEMDENDIIKKGLIIRHLVLPNNVSGTDKIMHFIADNLSTDTYISLMSQYSPYYRAEEFPKISRLLSYEEYEEAEKIMHKYNLENGWTQGLGGLERLAGVYLKPGLKEQ